MKSYNKICLGCGETKQTTNPLAKGYINNMENPLCIRCFRLLNYGEKVNNLELFEPDIYLKELQKTNDEVFLVVDVLNPQETVVKQINKYIDPSRLTLIVNKIDLLPHAISAEKIIAWIDKLTWEIELEFKQIILISTIKKTNIDALVSFMEQIETSCAIIGYSNVGKSSLIKQIAKSIGLDANNLVSNTVGTTTKPFEIKLNEINIIDFPGFILPGNYQNVLEPNILDQITSKKELKSIVYQLKSNQTISIGDLCYFNVLNSPEISDYQFLFSSAIELKRSKLENSKVSSDFITHELTFSAKITRVDIIISGFGIITTWNKNQKLTIQLPRGIIFNVVESIYN